MLKNKEFYKDKKVIVRVDYNVPIRDGMVLDDNRIRMSLQTINYLIESNAKIILMSHLGKVKSEEDKLINSLECVVCILENMVGKPVKFCKYTRGLELENMINSLKNGEILLIENTRFEDYPNNLESSCDMELSKYWASLADTFVIDAFGSIHRNHASTYGIPLIIGGSTGFLVDKELKVLNEILEDNNKIVLLGGKKIQDKLGVIENLVKRSKKVLLGGGMCFTFLKSIGMEVKNSLVDESKLKYAKGLMEEYKDKIVLPIDIKYDEENIGLDIGHNTIEYYKSLISPSDLVVWNGPMGMFEDEKYELGTKELLEYLDVNNIKAVILGGDTGNAAKKYNMNFYYLSTGGGSALEYLEGKEFECLKVLE